MNKLKQILADLIAFESITPHDAGCQDYLATKLQALGFTCTRYDSPPVANLYAQLGTTAPLLVFAGHTDVVPPGNIKDWDTPPFTLTEKNGRLYGRGVADMKGALAAMLVMAEQLTQASKFKGSLGFLITSGEEGIHFDQGTPVIMEQLQARGIKPDYCIVGEPSSHQHVGDTIKIGRRGSLTAQITIRGKQGHVAYPHLADNPIHKASQAIAKLATLHLDEGNSYFPASSLQITDLQSGTGASNVIPGQLDLTLNIRFSTEQDETRLKETVTSCFTEFGLTPLIQWRLNGVPFLTATGRLVETSLAVIENQTQLTPLCSTTGGTSDGRFIAPYGVEVIELGLCNGSIHQVNESIGVDELAILALLYEKISLDLLLRQ